MKENPIWMIDRLGEKAAEARTRIRETGAACSDRQGPGDCMVEVLAPAGYHQNQQIADAFGLEFDENLFNEDEWDHLRGRIRKMKARAAAELQRRFPLPPGFSFSLDYDEGGNFGLLIRPGQPDKSPRGQRLN